MLFHRQKALEDEVREQSTFSATRQSSAKSRTP